MDHYHRIQAIEGQVNLDKCSTLGAFLWLCAPVWAILRWA